MPFPKIWNKGKKPHKEKDSAMHVYWGVQLTSGQSVDSLILENIQEKPLDWATHPIFILYCIFHIY